MKNKPKRVPQPPATISKRILFHFHTRHSVDSNLAPRDIIAFAAANGIQVLLPTDHHTIRGAREIRELGAAHGIETIIGAEFSTDHGDIIGLFIEEDIFTRNANEVIEEIHAQGGLAILPHPYRHHHLTDQVLDSVDGIEVFNARLAEQLNRLAGELAALLRKPAFYGADAHLLPELSLVQTEVEIRGGEPLRAAIARGLHPVQLQSTRPAHIYRSKMIASARRRTPMRYLKSLSKMLLCQIRDRRH